ncbi:MAG: HepT-like ribonuclease domain-containing protein [Methyloceanibacter sp.]|uniref:HepT-like ribonuclease domain-containing protein n=1 Tax=Methyloceanibacter sp. TaxID=1965321 RepID=UPI003D6D2A67
MRQAIRDARSFTKGITYEDFQADAKTRLAVERCVEIIAEAARRLPASVQAAYPEIPWVDIRGIGNILRHGYDKVDDRIIWTVIERHLAPLEETLMKIAKAL